MRFATSGEVKFFEVVDHSSPPRDRRRYLAFSRRACARAQSRSDGARNRNRNQPLEGLHRHARDHWFRTAQSIPLNIAEGNGKRSLKDRVRFLDIARGSALECSAIQDVLVRTKGIKVQADAAMKAMLHRIVAMLTRMAIKFDGVTEYNVEIDYDYEHRYAEHEHESRTEETPEPWDSTETSKRRW